LRDLWDTCTLGILIQKYNLTDYFLNYTNLHKYIIEAVKNQSYKTDSSTWAGPGFLSTLITYLNLHNETTLSQNLFQELLNSQLKSGEFRGVMGEDGNDLVHPVWHTAQALITMLEFNISERDERIKKIIKWMKKTQNKNGSFQAFSQYSIYFTSNAIIALSKLKNKPHNTLEKAVNWLISNIDKNGNVVDSGGTIMTARALLEYSSDDIYLKANILDLQKLATIGYEYKILRKKYKKIKNQLKIVKNSLLDYEKKYSEADIVFSKKEAFYITILLAITLTTISMLPSIIPNFNQTSSTVKKINNPSIAIKKVDNNVTK